MKLKQINKSMKQINKSMKQINKWHIIAIMAILFLAGTLAFTLMHSNTEETGAPKSISVNINPVKYGILSYNKEYVAYTVLSTNLSAINYASVSLMWFENKPLTKVYMVKEQGVEAQNIDNITEQVKEYVLDYNGLSFDKGGPEHCLYLKDNIIVVPTGRMPKKIYENIDTILANGNVIVYIGMDIDYVIDDSGALIETYDQKSLRKSCPYWEVEKKLWSIINVNNSKGYMLHLDSAPDRTDKLPEKIIRAIIYNVWQEPLSEKTYTFEESKNDVTLYSAPALYSKGYVRIICYVSAENVSVSKISDAKISYPVKGRIYYKDKIMKGEDFDVTMKLRADYKEPVHLVLNIDFIHNNELINSQKLTEINIKRVWESTSLVHNVLHPGDYTVSVSDQFNNVWALAYIHVSGLYAEVTEIKENIGTFRITVDGAPMTGNIEVYIDNEFYITQRVSAGFAQFRLPKGKHNMKIVYHNSEWNFEFENNSETMLDRYIKYFAPALIIFAVIYLLFKRKSSAVYTLIVPKISEKPVKTRTITRNDIVKVFDKIYSAYDWKKVMLPISVKEFTSGIRKYLDNKDIYITEGNAIEILNGNIEKYGDYCIPKKYLKMNMELAVIKRKVHDKLISLGVLFNERKMLTETSDAVIFYGSKNQSSLNNLNHNKKIIIIFKDKYDKNQFIKKVMTNTDKFSLSVASALASRKIVVLTLAELEYYV